MYSLLGNLHNGYLLPIKYYIYIDTVGRYVHINICKIRDVYVAGSNDIINTYIHLGIYVVESYMYSISKLQSMFHMRRILNDLGTEVPYLGYKINRYMRFFSPDELIFFSLFFFLLFFNIPSKKP